VLKREKIQEGEIFHICNKSIANYGIFNLAENGQQFINRLFYYNSNSYLETYSKFLRDNKNFICSNLLIPKENSKVKFLAYNIMPDHYHLLTKILKDNVFSKYISDVENSFSKYLNTKNERKGPLWQSRFKSIKINNNEQLLHVSRYIHLNPTTNNIVEKPEEWQFSSYREYISNPKILKKIITEISIKNPKTYQKFVENRIDYQRKLKLIKKLILE